MKLTQHSHLFELFVPKEMVLWESKIILERPLSQPAQTLIIYSKLIILFWKEIPVNIENMFVEEVE